MSRTLACATDNRLTRLIGEARLPATPLSQELSGLADSLMTVSWMQFVAELVGHLAWPATLVGLAVAFRHPLTALIGDVSEGEAGPGGVKFKSAARRTAEAVVRSEAGSTSDHQLPESPAPAGSGGGAAPGPSAIEHHHASTSPELAVQGASRQIAQRLHELLGDGPVGSARLEQDVAVLAGRAHSAGIIPVEVLDSLQGLSVMHDLAQTAPERVTPTQAQEFQVLSKAILYTLSDRRLGRPSPSSTTVGAASPSPEGSQ
jgi:hypothetical protein